MHRHEGMCNEHPPKSSRPLCLKQHLCTQKWLSCVRAPGLRSCQDLGPPSSLLGSVPNLAPIVAPRGAGALRSPSMGGGQCTLPPGGC